MVHCASEVDIQNERCAIFYAEEAVSEFDALNGEVIFLGGTVR